MMVFYIYINLFLLTFLLINTCIMKTDSNKTNPKTLLGYLMALAVMVFSFNVSAQTDTISISMVDSYGDSWNGNSLIVDGVSYTDTSSTGQTDVTAVVDLSTCLSWSYDGAGSYQSENSWTITDASGAVLASGGGICSQFITGGGRAAAAGINALPKDMAEHFIAAVSDYYQ
jgi:hypothetical protein